MLPVYTPRRRLRQKTAAMVPAVEAESFSFGSQRRKKKTQVGQVCFVRTQQHMWPLADTGCNRKAVIRLITNDADQ